MIKLIFLSLLVSSIQAHPGYDFHGLGAIAAVPPIISAPVIGPAPILASAPIIKTIAPAPIIKTIAPAATSYATITKVHIGHPAPIVKTILAPQPILKSYYSAPLTLGHAYH
ncbi:hypothetical protein Zmor_010903 [Zophobas morio]|uniref:Uncharacterized protein n=1 Tax=Zophobas morio TaxID=2755281 RepID=A0AA38IS86_9CUCU|nr:hypothetical protein Zmor_010903 [Zophobas morio]